MKITANYGLKKPEGHDAVNIEDLNYNSDIVDKKIKEIEAKAEKAFTHASNGKKFIRDAIAGKDKNIIIPSDPTFEDLANSIRQMSIGAKMYAGKSIVEDFGIIRGEGFDFKPEIIFFTRVSKDGDRWFNYVYWRWNSEFFVRSVGDNSSMGKIYTYPTWFEVKVSSDIAQVGSEFEWLAIGKDPEGYGRYNE
ncbi:hypothetical protein K144312032_11870 [Clostridium tetani]|uniref:hypothetical protein n=1 Tax=Clostridium tetani TaxID=1513 RepID=UPI002953E252|nr:hypothetical protein [Clostridium tetani]BDR66959.1 hypothetical protein K144312032_11870 [Clostridium tetani]